MAGDFATECFFGGRDLDGDNGGCGLGVLVRARTDKKVQTALKSLYERGSAKLLFYITLMSQERLYDIVLQRMSDNRDDISQRFGYKVNVGKCILCDVA